MIHTTAKHLLLLSVSARVSPPVHQSRSLVGVDVDEVLSAANEPVDDLRKRVSSTDLARCNRRYDGFATVFAILSVVFGSNLVTEREKDREKKNRGRRCCSRLPGYQGRVLPSSSASGKRREREEGERGYAGCGCQTISHVDDEDGSGTVGDRKTSESFTSPAKEEFLRSARRGGRQPGRTVNVNKEGTHFFPRYFPSSFRTRDTRYDIDRINVKSKGPERNKMYGYAHGLIKH